MGKVLALGESLLRLSTSRGSRLSNTNNLDIYYGGAEANVASNLGLLGHDVEYATKLPEDNPLSQAVINQLKMTGVNTDKVLYSEGHLGEYFVEEGAGVRSTNIVYNRKYSAISLMKKKDWDFDELFEGVKLFHITGITIALSPFWNKYGVELIKEAKKRGITVSFDMNYRSKMWDYQTAIPTYQEIIPYIDYLSAGYLDAINFFGIEEVEGADWKYYASEIAKKYPNVKYIYGTNRVVINSNNFNMTGYIWGSQEEKGALSKEYNLLNTVDRIGAGDSYSAGILDGLLLGKSLQDTVEFAMAKAALKHTVHGDINLFTRSEIQSFLEGGAHINR